MLITHWPISLTKDIYKKIGERIIALLAQQLDSDALARVVTFIHYWQDAIPIARNLAQLQKALTLPLPYTAISPPMLKTVFSESAEDCTQFVLELRYNVPLMIESFVKLQLQPHFEEAFFHWRRLELSSWQRILLFTAPDKIELPPHDLSWFNEKTLNDAVKQQKTEVVELLLANGVNVFNKDAGMNDSPLFLAMQPVFSLTSLDYYRRYMPILQRLLAYGFNPNCSTSMWAEDIYPDRRAFPGSIHPDERQYSTLLPARVRVTPLTLASMAGNLFLLETLLAQGASSNLGEEIGYPLTIAMKRGWFDGVKMLLQHSALPPPLDFRRIHHTYLRQFPYDKRMQIFFIMLPFFGYGNGFDGPLTMSNTSLMLAERVVYQLPDICKHSVINANSDEKKVSEHFRNSKQITQCIRGLYDKEATPDELRIAILIFYQLLLYSTKHYYIAPGLADLCLITTYTYRLSLDGIPSVLTESSFLSELASFARLFCHSKYHYVDPFRTEDDTITRPERGTGLKKIEEEYGFQNYYRDRESNFYSGISSGGCTVY